MLERLGNDLGLGRLQLMGAVAGRSRIAQNGSRVSRPTCAPNQAAQPRLFAPSPLLPPTPTSPLPPSAVVSIEVTVHAPARVVSGGELAVRVPRIYPAYTHLYPLPPLKIGSSVSYSRRIGQTVPQTLDGFWSAPPRRFVAHRSSLMFVSARSLSYPHLPRAPRRHLFASCDTLSPIIIVFSLPALHLFTPSSSRERALHFTTSQNRSVPFDSLRSAPRVSRLSPFIFQTPQNLIPMSTVTNLETYATAMDGSYSRHSNFAGAPLPRIPRSRSAPRSVIMATGSTSMLSSMASTPASPPATIQRVVSADSPLVPPAVLVIHPPTPPRLSGSPNAPAAPEAASSSSSGSEEDHYVQMNPRVKRVRTPKMYPFRSATDSTPTPAVFQAQAEVKKGVAFPACADGNDTPRASGSSSASNREILANLDAFKSAVFTVKSGSYSCDGWR